MLSCFSAQIVKNNKLKSIFEKIADSFFANKQAYKFAKL